MGKRGKWICLYKTLLKQTFSLVLVHFGHSKFLANAKLNAQTPSLVMAMLILDEHYYDDKRITPTQGYQIVQGK